jgi:hypothetical protein
LHWHTSYRFTLIFHYFKFSNLSSMACLICNYLQSAISLFCLLFRLLSNVIVCCLSFDHCIALHSSSDCFWIPICYLQSFPTFMLLLVIDVKQFLNYPPILMHFSDLTSLLGYLIIMLFLCICTLVFIIAWDLLSRTLIRELVKLRTKINQDYVCYVMENTL